MEWRISVEDSDGDDGTGSEAGEPTIGDKAKDERSEELGGKAESFTGSG